MFAAVMSAERDLLDPAIRTDRSRVAAFIADHFREIGASGRVFDRSAIIAELAAERPEPTPRELDDVATMQLADDVVLLTYRLRGPSGVSRRSSIWRMTAHGPRIEFHQGTPAAGDA